MLSSHSLARLAVCAMISGQAWALYTHPTPFSQGDILRAGCVERCGVEVPTIGLLPPQHIAEGHPQDDAS